MFAPGCDQASINPATSTIENITSEVEESCTTEIVSRVNDGCAGHWTDYVLAENIEIPCPQDTDAMCIPAGPYRQVELPTYYGCDDLWAEDTLGLFQWVCDDGHQPIKMVSDGLLPGVSLSHLIDWSAMAWKQNALRVYQDSTVIAETPMETWWEDDVVEITPDTHALETNMVYLVTEDTQASIAVTVSNFAILVTEQAALLGATDQTATLSMTDGCCAEISGHYSPAAEVGIDFYGVQNIELSNVRMDTVGGDSEMIGISIFEANNVRLLDIEIGLVSGIGLYGRDIEHGSVSDVWVHGGTGTGIYFSRGSTLEIDFRASDIEDGHGIWLSDITNATILTLIADNNPGSYGLFLVDFNHSTADSLIATGNEFGIVGSGFSQTLINRVETNSNDDTGAVLINAGQSIFGTLIARDNELGLYLGHFDSTTIEAIDATSNSLHGIDIYRFTNSDIDLINSINNKDESEYYGTTYVFGTGFSINQSSNNTFRHLSIHNNGTNGLLLDGDQNTFFDVDLSDHDQGIFVGGDHNRFANVTIENSGHTAMYLGGSHNVVANSTINGATLYGIYIQNGADNIIVNSVISNIADLEGEIEDSYQWPGDGMTLRNSDSAILINIAASSNEEGIILDGSSRATISDIELIDIQGYGLNLAESYNNELVGENSIYARRGLIDYHQEYLDSTVTYCEAPQDGDEDTYATTTLNQSCTSPCKIENADDTQPAGIDTVCEREDGDDAFRAVDWIIHTWSVVDEETCVNDYHATWENNQCKSLFQSGYLEIMLDNIGNDNGLCEANEICTPNE